MRFPSTAANGTRRKSMLQGPSSSSNGNNDANQKKHIGDASVPKTGYLTASLATNSPASSPANRPSSSTTTTNTTQQYQILHSMQCLPKSSCLLFIPQSTATSMGTKAKQKTRVSSIFPHHLNSYFDKKVPHLSLLWIQTHHSATSSASSTFAPNAAHSSTSSRRNRHHRRHFRLSAAQQEQHFQTVNLHAFYSFLVQCMNWNQYTNEDMEGFSGSPRQFAIHHANRSSARRERHASNRYSTIPPAARHSKDSSLENLPAAAATTGTTGSVSKLPSVDSSLNNTGYLRCCISLDSSKQNRRLRYILYDILRNGQFEYAGVKYQLSGWNVTLVAMESDDILSEMSSMERDIFTVVMQWRDELETSQGGNSNTTHQQDDSQRNTLRDDESASHHRDESTSTQTSLSLSPSSRSANRNSFGKNTHTKTHTKNSSFSLVDLDSSHSDHLTAVPADTHHRLHSNSSSDWSGTHRSNSTSNRRATLAVPMLPQRSHSLQTSNLAAHTPKRRASLLPRYEGASNATGSGASDLFHSTAMGPLSSPTQNIPVMNQLRRFSNISEFSDPNSSTSTLFGSSPGRPQRMSHHLSSPNVLRHDAASSSNITSPPGLLNGIDARISLSVPHSANSALQSHYHLEELFAEYRIDFIERKFQQVELSLSVKQFIRDVIVAMRGHPWRKLLLSPRATVQLECAAKAYSIYSGSDYVLPDHVAVVAPYVLAHRLTLKRAVLHNIEGISTFILTQQVVSTLPRP